MIAVAPSLTLEAFLDLPETEPALEFVNGEIVQKPMPQGEHSRLQFKLCATVNQIAETQKIACAFPELRCVVGGDAIVPGYCSVPLGAHSPHEVWTNCESI
jgi:Uma2 family endonuclease